MNLKNNLDQRVAQAMQSAGLENSPAVVRPSTRPEFGHYQANGIMGAAKKNKANPRDLAQTVVEELKDEQLSLEIAGPGFINITLSKDFIGAQLELISTGNRLGIETKPKKRFVVDYSSPNLAKEMHIGHLRTTTIGDAAVRILEFLGQDVIRANHVGDWGAQFGSLLAYMDELAVEDENLGAELKDLERFYLSASQKFKSDPAFADKARGFVVKLQGGDEKCLRLWQRFITESIKHAQAVYEKLNITLTPDDIMAESSYNDDLPVVIEDLEQQGLLVEDNGAKCVFLDEFVGKKGNPLPAMLQKSDGGYPYMATDVTAVRYRSNQLQADNALYIVGAEQQLHFRQVFAVAKAAGYLQDHQHFSHYSHGHILKSEGVRFKTRDGADVKLIDVLEEAINRAYQLVDEKNPTLAIDEKQEVARVVGIGAIKYAELSKNRTTDYIFDWDTMLSFDGNTAPYLQYAYTRIRSIFRRESLDPAALTGDFELKEDAETSLALKLLQFEETLDAVLDDFQANILCNYLFELAGIFMSFYEACPVLKAEEPLKTSRLRLCDLTAQTLHQGLDLLGIETVEQM